ncbi:hypothetical protein K3495_g13699 [Podosphaera aphanis]|nr:hypothetical protein K3495_g13699 [Podosphaera aphanis]
MKRRLSTAFHPQTNGSTERMYQEVLAYLRAFTSYAQYEWPSLLPSAMLDLNNKDTSISLNPFFITQNYHAEPISPVQPSIERLSNPAKRARNLVNRLTNTQEYAQAAMASAQQRMEFYAIKMRKPQERYELGDNVWLCLINIITLQLRKKLTWINAKYRITRVISPHVVELDVPSGVYPRFHVDLLKRDPHNPLPAQRLRDHQPPPLLNTEGEEEQIIERILRAEKRPRGRGFRREVLVKRDQFEEPNWEPRGILEETEVLNVFESKYGLGDNVRDT